MILIIIVYNLYIFVLRVYNVISVRELVFCYNKYCTYIITGTKQFALLEKVITVTEENITQRQKMHEETMARQDKLLNILEKMITK